MITAPPPGKASEAHVDTSSSATFMSVQLNPHARVSPASTHHNLRGKLSDRRLYVYFLCDPSKLILFAEDIDFNLNLQC